MRLLYNQCVPLWRTTRKRGIKVGLMTRSAAAMVNDTGSRLAKCAKNDLESTMSSVKAIVWVPNRGDLVVCRRSFSDHG